MYPSRTLRRIFERRWNPALIDQGQKILGDRFRTISRQDIVGGCHECRAAPPDRDSELAGSQQFMVVFRIANGHHVVGRQAENLEHFSQARSLADGLAENHDSPSVEDKRVRQLAGP